MTPLHIVGTIDRMDRCNICCEKLVFKRLSLVPEAYYWYKLSIFFFSPGNLPRLAYAICNLCLYFFCNCKITNEVFESFFSKFHWKRTEGVIR